MTTLQLKAPVLKVRARWLPSVQDLSPHEQAYTKGYAEGWKKAQEDCRKEMEARIQASRAHWDSVVQSMNRLPKEMMQKAREQLISLSFQTVRKILAATPITREEVAAQVTQMLEHVEATAEIEVQLNPQDLEILTSEDKGALWNQELTHLKWVGNPSVPRGGCVLHGEFGWVDGRREAKLGKLEQVAQESVKQS
jgi:flagellar biosynthesis/type III secretory pathway protein FliH